MISYRKGKWLADILVKAKTVKACINTMGTQRESRRSVNPILTKKTKTIPKSRKNRLDMYANIPRWCSVSAITREKTIKLGHWD